MRGLHRVVDEGARDLDIPNHAAVIEALRGVAVDLLNEQARCCVAKAAASEGEARADFMVTEASRAVERLLKS